MIPNIQYYDMLKHCRECHIEEHGRNVKTHECYLASWPTEYFIIHGVQSRIVKVGGGKVSAFGFSDSIRV